MSLSYQDFMLLACQEQPGTHRERKNPMNNTEPIKQFIKKTIDLHVHIGPEIIPRKYTVKQLSAAEENNLYGAVLKNHFYPTAPLIKSIDQPRINLFGSVVLNNFIGGLNSEAIYASSLITDKPLMVWFPTVDAEQFLNNSDYQVAPEWINNPSLNKFLRKSKTVKGIKVCSNGRLTQPTYSVIKSIKETGSVLATGHISWQESLLLTKKAEQLGVKKIIITHPIYQKINMPLKIQKKLAAMGANIEFCYSMFSIDQIPIRKMADQIKFLGPENCLLSSDVGQQFNLKPSKALLVFAKKLNQNGISLQSLKTMLVKNPRKIMSCQ
jgi:hypothetical protein